MEVEGCGGEDAAPDARALRLPVRRAYTMLRLALLARSQLAAATAFGASHPMAAALHPEQARALAALSACYIAVFSAALVPAAAHSAGVPAAGAAGRGGGPSGTASASSLAAAAEAAALGRCPVCASQLRWSGGNASHATTGAAGGGGGAAGAPLPLLQPAPLFQPWVWMTEQIALQPPPEAVMAGALQAMESPWGGLQLQCTGSAAASEAAAALGSSSGSLRLRHAFRLHPLTLEPLAAAASGAADPAVMGLRSALAELAIGGPAGVSGRGGSAEAAGSLPPRGAAGGGQRRQLHAAQLLPSPTGFSY